MKFLCICVYYVLIFWGIMGELVVSGMNIGFKEKVVKIEIDLRGLNRKEEVCNKVSFFLNVEDCYFVI